MIVNPVSKTGKAAEVKDAVCSLFDAKLGSFFECRETSYACHATEIAASAEAFDTVIALGGDGVINEIVNGLMRISAEQRPVFGIIPVGSGNDFARTLHVSEDIECACNTIFEYKTRRQDVGMCNGIYYVETVSFGLDAAIALDTMERRKNSEKTGNALYFEAGLNQILFHRDMHSYAATIDNGKTIKGASLTFAVQIGTTYGGGFKICPEANPSDGLLDVCIAHPPLGLFASLALFVKAKEGKHTQHPNIEMFQCSNLVVDFEHPVPSQRDGEDCTASHFEISMVPDALTVIYAE